MVLMANRYILPAAYKHQEPAGEHRGGGQGRGATAKETRGALDEICKSDEAKQRVDALEKLLEHRRGWHAWEACQQLPRQGHPRDDLPARGRGRARNAVPQNLWPLLNYLLFVKVATNFAIEEPPSKSLERRFLYVPHCRALLAWAPSPWPRLEMPLLLKSTRAVACPSRPRIARKST